MRGLKKNRRHFFYALDIGSKKITLAAAEADRGTSEASILIETQPTRGIFKGVVNDLAALSDAVQQLFRRVEGRCNVKATQVALSINGNYINARNSAAALALSERGTRSITHRDVERLNRQARMLGLELEESLLHEYPQRYSIDRHNVTLSPLGLHGRKFEAELLLICAKAVYLENIIKAVEQAGLDVVNIVFSGIAASEAALSVEDKTKGVVFVDIGDALTSVLIFGDGQVRRMNILSFGGRNLTEIIANYCKIPLELADEIKESAIEIGHEIHETDEVMIKTEYDYKPIKKRDLISAIMPEIDKFIALLKEVIFDSGLEGVKRSSIVVVGGLGLLEGLLEKIEHDLGLPVKMGLVKGQGDISTARAAAYASAIGLLHLQREHYYRTGLRLHSQGKNRFSRIAEYIKTLYQDYF